MKKLISVLLCVVLVYSMAGCGNTQTAKKSANIIEIEGHEYDLSQDFDKVIDSMSKNGMTIVDMWTPKTYTGNGEWISYSKSNISTDSIDLYVLSRDWSKYHVNAFEFDYDNADFKTVDNISFKSSAEDLQTLEGYTSCYNISCDREQPARVALYEDGELIDLGKYRTVLKEIDVNNEDALKKFMYEDYEYATYAPFWMEIIETGMVSLFQSDISDSIKLHECMFGLATAEALYRLEQGEISSITVIRYSYAENPNYGDPGMMTRYQVITLADDAKAE